MINEVCLKTFYKFYLLDVECLKLFLLFNLRDMARMKTHKQNS